MTEYTYPDIARATIDRLVSTQLAAVDQAADLVATAIRAGGVLQAFGTGHARIITHEIAGRAGGLVPVNLVRLSDLVFHGDLAPTDLLDPTLERDPALAPEVYRLAGAQPGDPFLIVSNSGINGSIVEFALLVKEHGHPIIAITSVPHSTSVEPRHPSGRRLLDLADVLIDTGAPPGDAALDLPDGTAIGAVSNLAGIVIGQLLTEGICRRLLAAGVTPPVYRSMNLPDGDTANADLIAHYKDRVRPIEP